MTDLIDEITHDLQSEKLALFVKKATKIFSLIAVIIIIITIIFVWHKKTTEDLNYNLTEKFYNANLSFSKQQPEEGIKFLEQIYQFKEQQIAALAMLSKSSILIKQGKKSEALELLKNISEYKHYDLAIRNLATILYLENDFDNLSLEEFDKISAKIIQDKKPWRISALQLKALLLIKNNDLSQAKDILNNILKEKNISKSIYDITHTILNNIQLKTN